MYSLTKIYLFLHLCTLYTHIVLTDQQEPTAPLQPLAREEQLVHIDIPQRQLVIRLVNLRMSPIQVFS